MFERQQTAHTSALMLAGAVLTMLVAACRTTISHAPAGGSTAIVTRGEARRAWLVVDGERELGSVVRFESTGSEQAWFSVRNEFGQELGIVDTQGRAWRHRAHQREPEWLGSATVVEATRRILAAPTAEMTPIDLAALAARRERTP